MMQVPNICCDNDVALILIARHSVTHHYKTTIILIITKSLQSKAGYLVSGTSSVECDDFKDPL